MISPLSLSWYVPSSPDEAGRFNGTREAGAFIQSYISESRARGGSCGREWRVRLDRLGLDCGKLNGVEWIGADGLGGPGERDQEQG